MNYWFLVPPEVLYEEQSKWQIWKIVYLDSMDYEYTVTDVDGLSHIGAFEAFAAAVAGNVVDDVMFVGSNNHVHQKASEEFKSFGEARGIAASDRVNNMPVTTRSERLMNALEECVKRYYADLQFTQRRRLMQHMGMQ